MIPAPNRQEFTTRIQYQTRMNTEQAERYSRHINLPDVGKQGQQKLLNSTALIVGLGGLGSPIAMYLAAAGVGHLIFADFDAVELSNLQRQVAHTTSSIGQLKTHSAKATCLAMNPDIKIETIDEVLDADSLSTLVPRCDVVIEGSDNFPTRFAVNEACVKHKVPLVSGAAIRFDGQVSVFAGHDENIPCYRCLYGGDSDTAETCAQTGVLSPIVGIIGTIQATEAIKVLANFGSPLYGKLLLLDGLSMQWNEIELRKNPQCSICSG